VQQSPLNHRNDPHPVVIYLHYPSIYLQQGDDNWSYLFSSLLSSPISSFSFILLVDSRLSSR